MPVEIFSVDAGVAGGGTIGGRIGGGACAETASVTGWLSRVQIQSVPENPARVVSALTATAVMREKRPGFGSETAPAPPASSVETAVVSVAVESDQADRAGRAGGSEPVRSRAAAPLAGTSNSAYAV